MTPISVSLAAEQLRRRVPGGIGTYTRGLLKGIDELGTDERPRITIVASRPPWRPDPLASLGHPLVCSRLPGPLMTRAWDLGLSRVGRGTDVVHSVSLAAPVPSPGRPLVITVHDVAWRSMPEAYPERGRRWHQAALRRAGARAAVVVVPSEATAQAVVAAGVGITEDRLAIINEGADHLGEPDGPAAQALLDRLGVLGPVPAHREHARATQEPRAPLAGLRSREAGAARGLATVGRGTERVGAIAPGPAGRPPVSSLPAPSKAGCWPRSTQKARCCAYVPIVEGFGLPVVESMAQGTPVVSSPVPSSGGASLEVDPTDVSSIAEGLVAAAGDEVTRAGLVSSGLARAATLRWVETARAHVAIWERVVAEGQGGR